MGEWPVRLIPANVSPTTGLSRTLDQRPWSSGTIGKQTLEKKAATHRRAYLLALPGRLSGDGRHSHSIVNSILHPQCSRHFPCAPPA